MYKIFIECNDIMNLLSSGNVIHFVRYLLYINVKNSSHYFCG